MDTNHYSIPFDEFIEELESSMTRKQLSEWNKMLRKDKKALKTGRLSYEVSPITQEDGDYDR